MSQFFFNQRASLVNDVIEGTIIASPWNNLARLESDPAIRVVVRRDLNKNNVAVISGGGAGHEPAHVGFIGKGMLTAAVCGDLFASPSVDAVLTAIQAVTGEAGCLLIVKNYTGDRLNFGLAAEKARPSADEALGIKAVDYIAFAPKIDVNQAYQWLSQSVNAVKGESAGATIFYFLQMSLDKLKTDPNHKEQFIQDYLAASEYVDAAIAAEASEAKKKPLLGIKDNLVALFVNSGTADCESLQNIYGPKVEANQTDLAYLKKVIDIMKMMKCTESEAYLQASYYAYKMEPTAEAATGCAYQAFKKGDIDGAVKFFDEAVNLETDNVKKAEKAYAAAAVLASAKKLSQARAYCQKAIGFNENYGAPYILIANLYAMSPNWSDEPALNKCTYFAVIDKLQRAKQVDPSVAEEANKLIGRYSGHTPQAKDLFMLGYKQGDRITIGGWIGETTTIR